jgi:hypothetical protein
MTDTDDIDAARAEAWTAYLNRLPGGLDEHAAFTAGWEAARRLAAADAVAPSPVVPEELKQLHWEVQSWLDQIRAFKAAENIRAHKDALNKARDASYEWVSILLSGGSGHDGR